MKRDWELCRKILLQLEKHGKPFEVFANNDICGYSDEQIGFHTYLLGQAGLIETTDGWVTMNRPWVYYPTNITWEGYEFLDAARDESVWKKALENIHSKGIPVTLDLLKIALPEILKTLLQAS